MAFKLFRFLRSKSTADYGTVSDANLAAIRDLKAAGRLNEAVALCDTALREDPNALEYSLEKADLAYLQGDSPLAMQVFSELIASHPTSALVFYKRGNLLMNIAKLPEACSAYERAISLNPEYANAYCNLGVVLESMGQAEAALASFDHAIRLNPADALAHYNCAASHRSLKRPEAALASYDAALRIRADYFEALCNRGAVQTELKLWDAALDSLDRCVALAPAFAPAYFNRAVLHHKRKRRQSALADYSRALELRPEYPEAYAGRGVLWTELAKNEAALLDFDRATALRPDHVEIHQGRGDLLYQMRRFEEAIDSYNRALALKPACKYVLGMRRHAQMYICDWRDFDLDVHRIERAIQAGILVSPPFPIASLVDSARLQRLAAELYVREEYPEDDSLPEIPLRAADGRIRLGYFSADFRMHPVALLTARLFELHDRTKFEVIAFVFGPEANDEMTERLRRAFDRFIDVRHHSDVEVAALARELGIDIAIDLGGFTGYSRTGIFALRVARLQMSYIGYLGTLGASYMDYLVADETIVPIQKQQDYSEKIIYLPSYQANDSQRRMSGRIFEREELELPATGFVFCCFNAAYKITPMVFASWMRILHRVPDSSLFLYVNHQVARDHLSAKAEEHGVRASRLVFGAQMPVEDYLARYRMMDLFLDTSPYNAGTTASDALWSGVPVLTRLGDAFAARVAASLLTALGLEELIASSAEAYEQLAIELATVPSRFARIKAKLAHQCDTAALFDSHRFTIDLEAAYSAVYSRSQAGLPPAHTYPNGADSSEVAI